MDGVGDAVTSVLGAYADGGFPSDASGTALAVASLGVPRLRGIAHGVGDQRVGPTPFNIVNNSSMHRSDAKRR